MNVEREVERLAGVYAENSDEQLLEMYDRREDLTDVAQEALARVMKERGVVAKPAGDQPRLDPVVEEESTSEATAPLDSDEVCVWTFDDAFNLGEALKRLERVGIEKRVMNWKEVYPERATQGPPLELGLVIWRDDLPRVQSLLQDFVNVTAEQVEEGEALDYVLGFVPLGDFWRADAKAIADALGEGGFSYVWDDEMENSSRSGKTVSISVRRSREAKARALLEKKLGGLPFEAED